jgi:hypothetical protein
MFGFAVRGEMDSTCSFGTDENSVNGSRPFYIAQALNDFTILLGLRRL